MSTKKAGAIILDQEKQYVLLVHRLKKNDWSFPKGHQEGEEKLEETAVREALEETGYAIGVQKSLPDILYKSDSGQDIRLSMFLATSKEKVQHPEPGTTIEWVAVENVEKQLSYDNLKEYWRSIRTLIS